jgi:hypothetical protein
MPLANPNPFISGRTRGFNPGGVPFRNRDPINYGCVFAWLASIPYNLFQPRMSRATHNGTIVYKPYELGNGLVLDGSANGLDFGQLNELWTIDNVASPAAIALSFRIKLVSTAAGRIFSQWGSTAGNQNFVLSMGTGGALQLAIKGNGTIAQCQCTTNLAVGALTHVVINANGGNSMDFYFNAAKKAKTNTIAGGGGQMQNSGTNWQIGFETNESSAPISGLVDNMRLWVRPTSEGEIAQLYADPFAGMSFGRSRLSASLIGVAAAATAKRNYAVSVIS